MVDAVSARPRTPTIRPSLTAMSSPQPLVHSTQADCTHRSTSVVGEAVGELLVHADRPPCAAGECGVRGTPDVCDPIHHPDLQVHSPALNDAC